MHLERYQLKSEESFQTFEFISDGRNGKVHKIVQFTETNVSGVFNLGFGDKNIKTGFVDDSIITNNDDSQKVLVTLLHQQSLRLQTNILTALFLQLD